MKLRALFYLFLSFNAYSIDLMRVYYLSSQSSEMYVRRSSQYDAGRYLTSSGEFLATSYDRDGYKRYIYSIEIDGETYQTMENFAWEHFDGQIPTVGDYHRNLKKLNEFREVGVIIGEVNGQEKVICVGEFDSSIAPQKAEQKFKEQVMESCYQSVQSHQRVFSLK